jgi:hypothetical protein
MAEKWLVGGLAQAERAGEADAKSGPGAQANLIRGSCNVGPEPVAARITAYTVTHSTKDGVVH